MNRFRYALLGACAAALAFATTTFAGSGVGSTFNLGQTNTVNATSTLSGSVAGPQLQVTNSSSDSLATALKLNVASGHPPFKVNSNAKVSGLNADLLDGKDSTGLPYWKLGGNGGTTSSDFLGTTTAQPLNMKTNGVQRLAIDSTGLVGIPGPTAGHAFTVTSYGYYDAVVGVSSLYGAGVNGHSTDGFGVTGSSSTNYGVAGGSISSYGVSGYSAQKYGVYGTSTGSDAIYGLSSSHVGVHGDSSSASGVAGGSSSGYGVSGSSQTNDGVHGTSSSGVGVGGSSQNGPGVYGYSQYGSAGYFEGDVTVSGTLYAGKKQFRIDDPLDPAHKYLQHTSVESSDMLDIYTGNATTGARGFATVKLPAWFQALNRSFRYQLTVIDKAHWTARAALWDKIAGNRFTIRTDQPHVQVSWQVTGIRHDPYANANRTSVIVPKAKADQGEYLHPQLYGKPRRAAIGYVPVNRGGRKR